MPWPWPSVQLSSASAARSALFMTAAGQLQPLKRGGTRRLRKAQRRSGKKSIRSLQVVPGEHCSRPPERLAMPRGRALSLYLRRRPRALLFAAARLSCDPALGIHAGADVTRVLYRQIVRSLLHSLLRPAGGHARQLARPSDPSPQASPAGGLVQIHSESQAETRGTREIAALTRTLQLQTVCRLEQWPSPNDAAARFPPTHWPVPRTLRNTIVIWRGPRSKAGS